MPELPEVETVRLGLSRLLAGLEIKSVTFDWAKSFPNAPSDVERFLIGAKITAVRRRAKVLLIDLSTSYTLVIHLKMTGQMVFVPLVEDEDRFGAGHPNDSLVGSLPDKSTRVVIGFVDKENGLGPSLYFNDQRKFGWMRLIPTIQVEEIDFFKKVGPEPLESTFSASLFSKQLDHRKNTSIKAALLDQTVLAGIGNIYADESLWGARIHPSTKVSEVSGVKRSLLHKEIQYVLQLAIEKGGSTNRNYVNAEGKKGSYMDFARVFRRENLPCPRCATTIVKLKVAGRGTHICPKCQRIKK